MISIKRPPAPAFLTDPDGRWMQETQEAIQHYQNGNTKAFEFKMYNDTKVKDALKNVFSKCAYCESSYGAVYDGDVEHFRPKGKVNEKDPQTPGYFWLANDWDNLFLACQHCNQRRRHILLGETTLAGYGKMDQFPLQHEERRLKRFDGEISDEEPARLLINPCKDKPEVHFQYEKENAVMIPLTDNAAVSIKVYVLQRPYLVQERKKQMLKLFKQMAIAKHALEVYNKAPENEGNKQLFLMALSSVMDFTADSEAYAGMSRYFVKAFLRENGLS